MVLAEPLRVSPLIKVLYSRKDDFFHRQHEPFQTGRWAALLVGIWWGNKRWHANKATEDEVSVYVTRNFYDELFTRRSSEYHVKLICVLIMIFSILKNVFSLSLHVLNHFIYSRFGD